MAMHKLRGMKLKHGEILEIVRPKETWPGWEDWKGRFVIVDLKARFDKPTFRWMTGAPPRWHNKSLFVLHDWRGVFKRTGRVATAV